jgi:hypothetical protein
MKLSHDFATSCYLTSSEFTHDRRRKSDIAHFLPILTLAIAMCAMLVSCVESITISGRYADYKITPKKAVVIEEAK